MLKVVNTTVPENNPFHQYYPFTTFGVGFYHPPGFTEVFLLDTGWLTLSNISDIGAGNKIAYLN